jgi:hypothetical protein
MGVPNLKIKKELHYRHGYVIAEKNCKYCENFVESLNRCTLIGIHGGRAFNVLSHFTCDKQVFNRYINSCS